MPRRSRLDDELREEIEQYIELCRDELSTPALIARRAGNGAPPIGNVTRFERIRARCGASLLSRPLFRTWRYGLRPIRRSPAAALVAVLSLGLGIGGIAGDLRAPDVPLSPSPRRKARGYRRFFVVGRSGALNC